MRARGGSDEFRDNEKVPLICPTCQVSDHGVPAGDRPLLCMGLFSIFLVGSLSDGVWLREPRLKPHTSGVFAVAEVARSERFELPTLGIEIRCSIQLSYERKVFSMG